MQTTGKGAPAVEIHKPKKWANPNYRSSLAIDMAATTEVIFTKKHLSIIYNIPIKT
jgi:hypothetical protein